MLNSRVNQSGAEVNDCYKAKEVHAEGELGDWEQVQGGLRAARHRAGSRNGSDQWLASMDACASRIHLFDLSLNSSKPCFYPIYRHMFELQ